MTSKQDDNAEAATAEPNLARCAHANLRRAMRVVSQLYDGALKPVGLKTTQFTLLAVLSRMGPMPLGRLAEVLVLDRTTLTRNLRPLELRGLAETTREKDERVRLVNATDTGRALVDRAVPLWQQAQRRVAGRLGPARMEALTHDLTRLVEDVRQP